MNKNIGWHNGKWQDIESINLSIKNRGLKFSDGIFETILIKDNKAILLNEHIERFNKTLLLLNFQITLEKNFIMSLIQEGINKLSLSSNQLGSIRINYSRGINIDRTIKIHSDYNRFKVSNIWIEFHEINLNLNPISVEISQTEKRNEYSLLSRCKTFSYNQSIQVLIEANKNNFEDGLLLNTQNELCCGTTFNLLLKRNDIWLTPRKESGCFPGIMVSKLLKLKWIKEDYILPLFYENDILIAINSLSCKQIIQVNDLKLKSNFDIKNFWDRLYI
ncbi:MAG: aminotransferase class IV [Prochlorococcus sp. SP3034]|nr:aminotransferase class IV [Prochlorococcus sp. SP3034]|tara:strand:+ start:9997 stop:10824 length:828 start_codon:yes stop_codon:yes gene_type:complete